MSQSATVAGSGRFGPRHETDRALAARVGEFVDASDVATDAETPVAAKVPLAIEHRQSRQFDRKPRVAIVNWPGDGDAAPGFARGHGTRHLLVRIELQFRGDLAPQPAERGRGLRPGQFDELVRTNDEAPIGVHLPDEAQRMTPLYNRLRRRRTANRVRF